MSAAIAVVPFTVIKHAISKQFELMKSSGLFRTNIDKNLLWETYLAAFPEGTNPLFRERTEHDCQCCKSFVRTLGGVVAVVEGRRVSIWDGPPTGTPYDDVRAAMSQLVASVSIDNIFLHPEKQVGTEKSFEAFLGSEDKTSDAKAVRTWEHFHVHLPTSAVLKGVYIGPKSSATRSTFDVFKRGVEEITTDAIVTVQELIAQNSLYRGEDHKSVLQAYWLLKRAYEEVIDRIGNPHISVNEVKSAQEAFLWSKTLSQSPAVTRLRNTSIGTLLVDLSPTWYDANEDCGDAMCGQRNTGHAHEPKDLDVAVASFEAKMAPTNYKRPTALVTKAMIERAKKTIEDLGYTSALERRYAVLEDISVNEVLFVDRANAATLKKVRGKAANVFDDLAEKIPENTKRLEKVEEVPVAKFLADILPKAETLEVLFTNQQAGNLVSLVAPVDPGAKNLFKWPNAFSWSYAGDLADSIKARVKKAGGSVTGDLRCSLSWFNYDDLDLHMVEPPLSGCDLRPRAIFARPEGGERIYYGHKASLTTGGTLDVDMNAGGGRPGGGSRSAVENITYPQRGRMAEGVYTLFVRNYRRVEGVDVGFEVEVEFDGQVFNFVYPKAVGDKAEVEVAQIRYSHKDGFKIEKSLPASTTSKEVWGVNTNTFQKVDVVMRSPNYWGSPVKGTATFESLGDAAADKRAEQSMGVGNKHLFFMLDGCRNADGARGFYNEFLNSELDPHRKTMEMVGAKMRTDESDRQLSGLGFSTTQRASLLVRVGGSFQRTVKVLF